MQAGWHSTSFLLPITLYHLQDSARVKWSSHTLYTLTSTPQRILCFICIRYKAFSTVLPMLTPGSPLVTQFASYTVINEPARVGLAGLYVIPVPTPINGQCIITSFYITTTPASHLQAVSLSVLALPRRRTSRIKNPSRAVARRTTAGCVS